MPLLCQPATGSAATAATPLNAPTNQRYRLSHTLGAVLLLFGIATTVLALTYHTAQRNNLERTAAERLSAIAQLKVSQIQHWRNTLRSDARWIQESPEPATLAQRVIARPEDAGAREEMRKWMATWTQHHGCLRAELLDAQLKSRLGVPPSVPGLGRGYRNEAAFALGSATPSLGEMHQESTSGPAHLDLLIPLRSPNVQGSPQPFGLLVLEIDLQAHMFPTIQSWPAPSRSGETLLVRRDGEEIVYLNELRHRTNTALKLRFPMTQRELPAVQAVLGEQRLVTGLDYRGEKVLAALGRVPDSSWAVVSKEDLEEIHEPLMQLAWTLGGVAGLVLLAGTTGVGAIWLQRERRFVMEALHEHQRAEEVVRASEARLHKLYTSMTEMLVSHEVVMDSTGKPIDYRILDCNPAFEKITGITRDRAIGSLASALYGTGQAPYLEIFARVAATGEHAQFETFFAPMDRHFAVAVFSPQPGWFATLSTDITERMRQREKLQALLHDLEEKTKELESIIYVASHDLRSPLINIQGFTTKLDSTWRELSAFLTRPEIPADIRSEAERLLGVKAAQSLQFIRSSSEKLNLLIRGLLVVSRAGRETPQSQAVDMNKIARSTLDSVQYQLQLADASIHLAPLPPCAGDPQALGQILANLLDNAIKYREPSRQLAISITAVTHASEVEYRIEDNGIGIAPEHQEKIWELFRRLHPETPSQGEGIGLSLVRRLAKRMHGRAWATSTPGQGSCFHIALPTPNSGSSLAPI